LSFDAALEIFIARLEILLNLSDMSWLDQHSVDFDTEGKRLWIIKGYEFILLGILF
jgi:hypothetical protein